MPSLAASRRLDDDAIVDKLVEAHPWENQGVYVQITRGVAPRDHSFPKGVQPTVFIMSNRLALPSAELVEQGMSVSVREDITLEVVTRYLRRFDVLPDHTDQVFVVDREDIFKGVLPINLIVAKRPEDLGLLPDGERANAAGGGPQRKSSVVDAEWAAINWTVKRAVRTSRFWWLALSFFCGGYIWYAVQVHQTKYLVEIGFSPMLAAWSLGLVAMVGIPGQILLGGLSDRYGREPLWAASCAGFAICYAALLAMAAAPSQPLLYLMVLSQGGLGYAFTAIMGPIVAEIFEGKSFGSIFSLLMTSLIGGGAIGPFVTGVLYDRTGTYHIAFAIGLVLSIVCAVAVYIAAPGKVRHVAGKV